MFNFDNRKCTPFKGIRNTLFLVVLYRQHTMFLLMYYYVCLYNIIVSIFIPPYQPIDTIFIMKTDLNVLVYLLWTLLRTFLRLIRRRNLMRCRIFINGYVLKVKYWIYFFFYNVSKYIYLKDKLEIIISPDITSSLMSTHFIL